MAQFDVFVNPIPSARSSYPYIAAMQSDFAATPSYQVVAPIAAISAFATVGRLTPKVEIQGSEHVVLVPQMTALRLRELTKSVASLAAARSEILAAIDLLFFGV